MCIHSSFQKAIQCCVGFITIDLGMMTGNTTPAINRLVTWKCAWKNMDINPPPFSIKSALGIVMIFFFFFYRSDGVAFDSNFMGILDIEYFHFSFIKATPLL